MHRIRSEGRLTSAQNYLIHRCIEELPGKDTLSKLEEKWICEWFHPLSEEDITGFQRAVVKTRHGDLLEYAGKEKETVKTL
jgi:hypothetical protein